jgi:hypothetical protein
VVVVVVVKFANVFLMLKNVVLAIRQSSLCVYIKCTYKYAVFPGLHVSPTASPGQIHLLYKTGRLRAVQLQSDPHASIRRSLRT